MKVTLDKALSLVALGVLSVMSAPASASITTSVYKIENLDANYDLKGSLEGLRNGYGMGVSNVNGSGELVGISKGRTTFTEGDIAEGVLPEEEVTLSVNSPIIANTFAFFAKENGQFGPWIPEFDSINDTTPPKDTNLEDPTSINSVDTLYYGINNQGTKIGTMTGVQKTLPYSGTNVGQDFWYYRDFEVRGVAKTALGEEIPLLPPFVTYSKQGQADTLVGGTSEAKAINNSHLVVGSASTALTQSSTEIIDACYADGATLPVDICVQANQFPTVSGTNIRYQTRGYVWQLEPSNAAPSLRAVGTELPLGLTPAAGDTNVYAAQAFAVNNNQDPNMVKIAGRSNVERASDFSSISMDAAWWNKNPEDTTQYVYHHVPMTSNILSSLAYGINDNGLLVGSYKSYIDGYIRSKFFTYDTNQVDAQIDTPRDFNTFHDASSTPRAVNNQGLVVGSIEVTADKDIPRQKTAFLYDNTDKAFVDLNKRLTCESKGYEADGNTWKRHPVSVSDGSGSYTYLSEIKLVDANAVSDDGTIVGTALIRKPKYKIKADGSLDLDANGHPQFELNGFGEPLTQLVPRAVVLKPEPNGQACTMVDPDDSDAPFVRQGGAGIAWLLILPLLWLRRRIS